MRENKLQHVCVAVLDGNAVGADGPAVVDMVAYLERGRCVKSAVWAMS